ncbi:hypothetical protein B0H19DRAFT_1245863 [Mycena capillaripes]|nr:hypothetical protein B0H19DRAFT_1245863 [Mycena capillaripes]
MLRARVSRSISLGALDGSTLFEYGVLLSLPQRPILDVEPAPTISSTPPASAKPSVSHPRSQARGVLGRFPPKDYGFDLATVKTSPALLPAASHLLVSRPNSPKLSQAAASSTSRRPGFRAYSVFGGGATGRGCPTPPPGFSPRRLRRHRANPVFACSQFLEAGPPGEGVPHLSALLLTVSHPLVARPMGSEEGRGRRALAVGRRAGTSSSRDRLLKSSSQNAGPGPHRPVPCAHRQPPPCRQFEYRDNYVGLEFLWCYKYTSDSVKLLEFGTSHTTQARRRDRVLFLPPIPSGIFLPDFAEEDFAEEWNLYLAQEFPEEWFLYLAQEFPEEWFLYLTQEFPDVLSLCLQLRAPFAFSIVPLPSRDLRAHLKS